jgi:hypothetical protein
MKINLIIDKQIKDNDSQIDINIISFLFRKIKDTTNVTIVDNNNYTCDKASINIFFNCVNNLLLNYAKYNILIPNQNLFNKHWTYALNNFDLILAKTHYIEEIFAQLISKNKIKYIGWRSTDIQNNYEKEYDEFLLYCYDTKYTNYKKIIDNWSESYPKLNVINGTYFGLTKKQDNIIYHNNLTQPQFENLYNKCGVHLCLDECYNFNHNLNQCTLVKSIPICVKSRMNNCMYNKEDNDIFFSVNGSEEKLQKVLGKKYSFDDDSFNNAIQNITNTSLSTLEIMGNNCRKYALKTQVQSDCLFKDTFSKIIKDVRNLPKTKINIIADEDLPHVSIMTLVHNRNHMFKLAVYNFNTIDYPKEKIQWVIYDTSNNDEKVEDLLPNSLERDKLNITYIHKDSKDFIGTHRNHATEFCKYDIIAIMDDDDYYKPGNIRYRVTQLINNDVSIVGCTVLGVFDINKYVSFIDGNSYTNIGSRISPASLCFKKNIINDNCRFCDSSIHECKTLINNISIKHFKEICFDDVLICLSHKNNTTNRNVPKIKPNGNHFKFNEKLLEFILKLDE